MPTAAAGLCRNSGGSSSCEASKLLLELPSLSGAGGFLLLTQAVSTSSPHFPVSRIPQLVLSEMSPPASTADPFAP